MRKSSLWILRAERERSPLQPTTPVGSTKSSNTTRSNGTSVDTIKSVTTARAAGDFNEQLRLLLVGQKEIDAGDLKPLYQRRFDMSLNLKGRGKLKSLLQEVEAAGACRLEMRKSSLWIMRAERDLPPQQSIKPENRRIWISKSITNASLANPLSRAVHRSPKHTFEAPAKTASASLGSNESPSELDLSRAWAILRNPLKMTNGSQAELADAISAIGLSDPDELPFCEPEQLYELASHLKDTPKKIFLVCVGLV